MRLLALVIAALLVLPAAAAEKTPRFIVYYGSAEPAARFSGYDVIVFDEEAHPDLTPLKHQGKTLLGYLSLGEVTSHRPYYAALKAAGAVLAPAPEHPDAYALDWTNDTWIRMVIEERIPALLRRGYNGIMIDTADRAGMLEKAQPKRHAGMNDAAVRLIRTIRMHYPDMPIMLNRGFDILPQVAGDIDMVLAESIYAFYDAKTAKSNRQPDAHYASVAQWLNALRKEHPALTVYTLDYWPQEDEEGIQAIYAAQRSQGFIPYVTSPSLQELWSEPKGSAP